MPLRVVSKDPIPEDYFRRVPRTLDECFGPNARLHITVQPYTWRQALRDVAILGTLGLVLFVWRTR